MSILFSGDFHASVVNELSSVTKNVLLKKYGREKYDGIKYHIKPQKYLKKQITDLRCTMSTRTRNDKRI
jgi:hypothetical protein